MKTSAPAAFTQLFNRTALGIRPGLEVISALLGGLGHPERAFPCVHVAGTNGKGSVCAMVEAMLRYAGYRTGLYTSPHLVSFHERFKLNGQSASTAVLLSALQRVEAVEAAPADQRAATFFECATAMAFDVFREQSVQWGVIETGMGGRWDATNVHVPAVAAITPIALDHMQYLGHDISGIATEKAGIIKPGVPVVIGALAAAPRQVVLRVAQEVGATVIDAVEVVRIQARAVSWSGQKIKIASDQADYRPLLLPLLGDHQVGNCAVAVAVFETLAALGRIEWSAEAVEQGLAAVQWPARFQVLSEDPVVILDVAHNPSGAKALVETVRKVAGDIPMGMVVGFLEDKDVRGCLRVMAQRAQRFWAVPIAGERGQSAEQILDCAQPLNLTMTACSLPEAIAQAKAWAQREGGIVCIAGSLYLAGAVLEEIG